jgi:RimJ/RimL family protein N-acetyltransferase
LASEVALRAATAADVRTIFEWRNDPFLIERSTSRQPVEWEQHQEWFAETLKGDSRRMFIIVVAGENAGQVRFDRHDETTSVISVYLEEQFTGRGFGIAAIQQGAAWLWKEWPGVKRIVACVRKDNPPASSAFRKAGFQEEAGNGVCPENHWSFVLTRGKGIDG